MKFEIKHRYTGSILFSLETTSMKLCVEAAVKSGADLSGADLYGANLYGANLSGADLSRANLYGANLYGANLSGANLSGANLSRANLSGANLSGAAGLNKYLVTPLLMLYDQVGPITAYKLVTDTWTGPSYPGISYNTGDELSEPKADCDDNVQCGKGLNIATLDWCMKEWREGYHILKVQFFAEDIAAIPINTDGKFRVRRLVVMEEVDLVKIGLVKPKEKP